MPGLNGSTSGLRGWLLCSTALFSATASIAQAQTVAPNAMPTGGQVVAGSASIAQGGNQTTIVQSTDRAAINWQQFNVGSQARVDFQQPGTNAWALNRVVGPDPSVIAGRITANGGVAIVNQSGVVFAQGAQVNVANLIASTANISNENFMAGRMIFDQAGKPGATIENNGSITVADRGMAALVAPGVANNGVIRARMGKVALQGAETYTLDLAGDGLLSIDVTQSVKTAPNGRAALVTNSGTIDASGGSVLISAQAASGLLEDLVKNTGTITANAAGGRAGTVALRAEGGGVVQAGTVTATGGARAAGGTIEVRGSTATVLTANSLTDASGGAGGGTIRVGTTGVGRNQTMSQRTTVARGARVRANAAAADGTGKGNGGTIAVNSTDNTVAEGDFAARGGSQGGNGGLVELSGQGAITLDAGLDLAAPMGIAGTLLLDPTSVRVVADSKTTITDPAADPRVIGGTDDSGALTISASLVSAGSIGTVTLQASKDISIEAAVDRGTNTLQLFADRNITQSGTGTITAGTLVIRGTSGADGSSAQTVTLDLKNNIGILDANITGSLSLNNDDHKLSIAHIRGAGADVSLTTNGAMEQLDTIQASTLTLSGSGAGSSINLGLANNVGTIDAQTGGFFLFSNGDNALVVAQISAPNQVAQLWANGGVTQTGTITAGELQLRGTGAGSGFTLDATNKVGTLQVEAGGDVLFKDNIATLTLTNVDAAGQKLTLQTNGLVTQQAASVITTDELVIRGLAGGNARADAIRLTQDNAVGTFNARATNDIAFTNGNTALTVTQAFSNAGDVTIGGKAVIAVQGAITGNTVTLNSVGGAITDGGSGLITADALSITGTASSVVLDRPHNVGGLQATADGDVTFDNGTHDLRVQQVDLAGHNLTLRSSGALTQETKDSITTDLLTIRGTGGADTSAAGHVDLAGSGNAVGTLDLRSTDNGGTATFDNGAKDLVIRQAVSTKGDVDISGGVLTVGDGGSPSVALSATSGGTATLRGDSVAFAGSVSIDGDSSLRLSTLGMVTQSDGTLTVGQLLVRGSDLASNSSAAASLTLGEANHIGALDAVTKGAIDVTNGDTALTVTRALSTTDGVTITGGSSISVANGSSVAPSISAAAGSDIVLTAQTDLNLGYITATANAGAGGNLVLTATDGSITQSSGTGISGSNITLAAQNDITLGNTTANGSAGANGDLTLTATDGSITQLGGSSISLGGALRLTAGQRAILGESANSIASLGDSTVATKGLSGSGPALEVATKGALVLTGDIDTTGTTAAHRLLLNSGGTITQAAGKSITAGQLELQAPSSVTLTNAGNDIRRLGDSTIGNSLGSGSLQIATSGDIAVTGTVATSGLLTSSIQIAADAIDVTGTLRATGLFNSVRLLARSGNITQEGGTVATGALAAQASGGIDLDSTANQVTGLTTIGATVAGNAVTAGQTGYGLRALNGDIALTTGGALLVNAPVSAVSTTNVNADTGSVSLTSGGLMTIISNITANTGTAGTLVNDALGIENPGGTPDNILFGAGRVINLSAANFLLNGATSILAPGGTVILKAANPLDLLGIVSTAGGLGGLLGTIQLGSTGNLDLSGITSLATAGTLVASADGNITQSSALTLDSLSLTAGGSIILTDAGNQIGVLRNVTAGGDVSITSSSALRVLGAASGNGITAGDGRTITLTSDNLDIRASITAENGTVHLQPLTAGTNVLIGFENQAVYPGLNLSRAELLGHSTADGETTARIRAGTLVLGNATTTAVLQGEQALDLTGAGGASTLQLLGANAIQYGALKGSADSTAGYGGTIDGAIGAGGLGVQTLTGTIGGGGSSVIWLGADNAIGTISGLSLNAIAGNSLSIDGTLSLPTGAITIRQGEGKDLVVAGAGISAPSTGRVTLVADDLDLQSAVTALGGTVELAPRSAGRGVTLGGSAAGTLSLSEEELARIQTIGGAGTGTLRIGSSTDAAVAGITGGAAAIGRSQQADGAAVAGTHLAGDVAIVDLLNLSAIANTLSLSAGVQNGATLGSITQTGDGLQVTNLTGSARGSVSLTSDANLVGTLGNFAAGLAATNADQARFELSTLGAGLVVNGTVTAGVNTAGGVQQEGGAITLLADDLALETGLLRTPNGTVYLAPLSSGRAVALGRDPADLLSGTGNELSLSAAELQNNIRAGAIVIGQDAGGFVTAGSIRQYGVTIDLATGATSGTGGTLVEGRAGNLTLATSGEVLQRGLGSVVDETEGNGPGGSTGARGALLTKSLTVEADGRIWLGADNAVGALTASSGQGITLRQAAGASVTINGITAGDTQTVALIADGMEIAGPIAALNGLVELAPRTAGLGMTLGGETAGTLSLGTAELGQINTSLLRIGQSNDVAVLGNGAWPINFAIDGGAAGYAGRLAGNITIAGDVLLRGNVDALEIFAGTAGSASGSINQTGGRLDVASLAGEARLDALFGSATNTVDRLAARSDDPNIAFRTGLRWTEIAPGVANTGSFTLNTVNALTVDASVIAAGGSATALTLGTGGALTLANDGIWLLSEQGSVTLTAAGALSNPGQIVGFGGGSITAGSLSNDHLISIGNGTVNVTGLLSNPGYLAAGTVDAGTLANNGVLQVASLTGLTGNTGTIISGGTVSGSAIDNSGSIAAAGLVATTSLTNSGIIALGSTLVGGTASVTGAVTNTGNLYASSLTAGGTITNSGLIEAGGRASAADDLVLDAPTARALALAGSPLSPLPSGIIAGGQIDAGALDRTLTVQSTGGGISTSGTVRSATGDVELLAKTDIAQTAGLIAGNIITLDATDGNVTQTANSSATLQGTQLIANAGGVVDLSASLGGVRNNTVTTLTGLDAGGDATILVAGGLLVAGNTTATGALTLDAKGDLSAGAVTIGAGDGLKLTSTGIGTFAGTTLQAGQDLVVVASTGLILSTGASATSTGGAVDLSTGGAASLAGVTLKADTDLTLAGTSGLTLTSTGATSGGAMQLTTGGDASLTGSTLGAGTSLAVAADGSLVLSGANASSGTGALGLSSGTTTTITGGTLDAGDNLAITATGDLAMQGGSKASSDGTLALTSSGATTLTQASLTGGTGLTVDTKGALVLDRTSATATTGSLGLTSGTGTSLSASALGAEGDLAVTASGSLQILTGSTANAGGELTLKSGDATTLSTAGLVAGGALEVTSTGNLVVTASSAQGDTLSMTTQGTATFAGSALVAKDTLDLTSTGGLTITGGSAQSGGAMSIDSKGAASFDTASLTAGGTLGITSASGLTVTGSTAGSTGAMSIASGGATGFTATGLDAGGALGITSASDLTVKGGSAHSGGDLTIASGGVAGFDTTSLDAGAALGITSTGAMTVTGGSAVSGAAMSMASGGAVGLDGTSLNAGGTLVVTAANDLTVTGGATRSGAAMTLASGGGTSLSTASLDAGGALGVTAAGNIAITAGHAQSGDALSLKSGGTTSLNGAALAANGALGVDAGSDLAITGGSTSSGATMSLASGGSATLDTASLDAGGALGVTIAGNLAITAGHARSGDTLSLSSGGTTNLAGAALAANGALGVDAGSDLVAADTSATSGGAMSLASRGAVNLTTGSLDAGTVLGVGAAGDLLLKNGGARSGGAMTMSSGGSTTLDTASLAASGALGVTAGGNLVATASGLGSGDALSLQSGGGTSLAGTTLAANGALGVNAGSGLIINGGSTRSGGIMAMASGGATSLSATSLDAAAALGLSAVGDLSVAATTLRGGDTVALTSGGSTQLGTATLAAGTDLAVTAGGNIGVNGGSSTANGALALGAGGTIDLAATALNAGSALQVTAGNALILADSKANSGGSLGLAGGTATSLARTTLGAGTDLAIDAGTGLTIEQGSTSAGASLAMTSGGGASLNTTSLTAGGSLDVTATGDLAVTGGSTASNGDMTLAGGNLVTLSSATLRAGGELAVTAGASLLATDTNASANALTLVSGGDTTLARDTLSAGGALLATVGGGLSVQDGLITADTMVMTSGGGGSFSRTNVLAGNGLSVTAGGSLVVADGRFTVATTSRAGSRPGMALVGSGLSLSQTNVTAEDLFLGAGAGRLDITGGGLTIGHEVLMTGASGINLATTITPRGGELPLVILDSRASGALGQSRFDYAADQPGLEPDAQLTQVASQSRSGSNFGAAANADAGGEIVLDLAAPGAAVFLLLNGANVDGTIEAGRLGIYGTGGKSELSGSLGDLTGSTAARLGRITWTIANGAQTPGALTQYRFNQCVIGSINCTVVAIIQPVINPLAQVPILRLATPPTDPDALLPNVTEEDY